MIEKEIFKVIQRRFSLNTILQNLQVLSFVSEESAKPFVVFGVQESSKGLATIFLEVQSNYQGVAEALSLEKEMREALENDAHEEGGYAYVFKDQASAKNNQLIFNVKRFKAGE